MASIPQDTWEKFNQLIEAAAADPNLRRKLEHGTPAMKLEILEKDYGITWDELNETHKKLENIIFTGSLKWWFW